MSQNSLHDISVQKVFDLISDHMKDAHDVLLEVLHKEPNYTRLLKAGGQQFFDAPSESSIQTESLKSRLFLAKTNLLALEVDRDIDKIVQEKFQGEILDNLKEQVLQAILWLSSGQVNSSDVSCQDSTFLNKVKKENESPGLVQITNFNNNCIQNNGRQASNDTKRQAKSSLAEKLNLDDCDADLSILSFESVSSVHTSDLSSFEDEISLSSEEEFGDKKRLSLREVQEKLELSKSEEEERTVDIVQDSITIKTEEESDSPENAIESPHISPKSQRKRKPNLKYTDDNILLPLKKKSYKKTSNSSRSVSGDTPRKRGRPKKHHSTP